MAGSTWRWAGGRTAPSIVLAVVLTACGGSPAPEEPVPVPPQVDEPVGTPAEVEPPETPPDTAVVEPVPDPEPEPAEPEPDPTPVEPEPGAGAMASSFPVLPNALLPRQRIVAFYGNPASKRMGILGELPPEEMLQRLDEEVAKWRVADPATPVKPALHMIAVMAAGDPGRDSLYRIRMPSHRIRQVMEWADRRDALVFLDIQPGRSSVAAELPRLEEWLTRPHVHLALDPEWDMPPDALPGKQIGSMSAEDINIAIEFLAGIVEEYDLPPKVLVVHRFTENMIRNAEDIRLDPRVQVVVNMDGWGPPSQKIYAYRDIVAPEAEQFTGFKLFFRNDRRGGSRLLTPEEILELDPTPIYIQYQ